MLFVHHLFLGLFVNDLPLHAQQWTIIETRVHRRAMAQVSACEQGEGRPPRYSIRVGTLHVLADGSTRINSHLSIYDAPDGALLLDELSQKYAELRDAPVGGGR